MPQSRHKTLGRSRQGRKRIGYIDDPPEPRATSNVGAPHPFECTVWQWQCRAPAACKASQLLTTLAVAPRQIMDRILGRKNRPRDPLRAGLGNAPRLQGAARHKTAAHRGKHEGVEKRGKLSVVGTVYESRLIRIE